MLQFLDWGLLPRALLGVLCLLCGNGYIVGINQIYDVDIDAVNKPFLPVAAGMPSFVLVRRAVHMVHSKDQEGCRMRSRHASCTASWPVSSLGTASESAAKHWPFAIKTPTPAIDYCLHQAHAVQGS